MLCEIINERIKIISWFACEINKKLFPWLTVIKEPHRVINFLEMIGAFIGARLYATGHDNPDELRWADFDVITDNRGNSFIVNKCFASSRPVAWALHELIALSLDKSLRFNATFKGGESCELSKKTDRIS